MRLSLPPAERSGDMVVQAEGLSLAWGDEPLFDDLELTVRRGERIGIVGPNGSGKSSLVKCLLGEVEPTAGTVRTGSRLNTGWFRQTQEHLDGTLTVWQYLQSAVGSSLKTPVGEQQARDLAGAFLFSGKVQDQLLGSLSGGERTRAVIAALVGGGHNLLVLDEPTNHLDIASAERLEQALARDGAWEGTLLLISHDRALLASTCEQLLVLDGEGGVQMILDVEQWLQRPALSGDSAASSKASVERGQRRGRSAQAVAPVEPQDPLRRLSMRDLESRIEQCEGDIAALDDELVKPEVYSDGDTMRELTKQRQSLVDTLVPLEMEWERRAGEDST